MWPLMERITHRIISRHTMYQGTNATYHFELELLYTVGMIKAVEVSICDGCALGGGYECIRRQQRL
jgi:hypothetical protein